MSTIHDLGDGSAVRLEPDGGLTFYLDHRNPKACDCPEWVVSHAMGPAASRQLHALLHPGA